MLHTGDRHRPPVWRHAIGTRMAKIDIYIVIQARSTYDAHTPNLGLAQK